MNALVSEAAGSHRLGLEIAGVLHRYGEAYRAAHTLALQQLRAMGAIKACRTAALGGHLAQCDQID